MDEYEKLLVEAYKNCTTECTIEEDKCYVTYVDDFYHRIRVLSINDQMVGLLIDWLVFNANFSNISAISWHKQILLLT